MNRWYDEKSLGRNQFIWLWNTTWNWIQLCSCRQWIKWWKGSSISTLWKPLWYWELYGVDINSEYLQECAARYENLNGILECLCVDLSNENTILPYADIVIANLLVEYIGYECFKKIVTQIKPKYVSCIIQINIDDSFVSDSPYLHVLEHLDIVHHQVEEDGLVASMENVSYRLLLKKNTHCLMVRNWFA